MKQILVQVITPLTSALTSLTAMFCFNRSEAYAQFAGAPLKLRKISNPWRSPSGALPALRTNQRETLSRPSDIIIHLRKQAAAETTETDELLRKETRIRSIIHTIQFTATGSSSTFIYILIFIIPPLLLCKYNADYDLSAKEGADSLAFISLMEEKLVPALIYTFWVEPKNYVDVTRRWYAEHMPFPLNFFLPGRMQRQQLEKLRLLRGDEGLEAGEELEKELYFPETPEPEAGDFDHVPNKRRKQFLSLLVALGAMLSYALLTGMVSIQHVQQEALEEPPDIQPLDHEEEGDG
ncbi:hypothetical protein INR49_006441 [Caranx melampygus]|nr:hypothetical protein INR49_006441 [Caranx melampygus]